MNSTKEEHKPKYVHSLSTASKLSKATSYLKCFQDSYQNLPFYIITSKFTLGYAI
jgi:hypothetical protein